MPLLSSLVRCSNLPQGRKARTQATPNLILSAFWKINAHVFRYCLASSPLPFLRHHALKHSPKLRIALQDLNHELVMGNTFTGEAPIGGIDRRAYLSICKSLNSRRRADEYSQ